MVPAALVRRRVIRFACNGQLPVLAQGVVYEQVPVRITPEFKALYDRSTEVWHKVPMISNQCDGAVFRK